MSTSHRRVLRRTSPWLLACALAACGPGAPSEVTFEVTGNDLMKFDVERFEVDAPAKVTIRFRNVGSMPKVAMGHNLVVLKQGVDALEFASECISNGATVENQFLPEQVRGKTLGATKVLGPGEEDTIVVDLPSAGVYPYVCTFPAVSYTHLTLPTILRV